MVMENFTIEKMEIKRFNALLVRTIASTLLLGWIAWWIYCIDNNESTWGMSYFNAFVLLIYAAVAWKTSATLEKIKNDKRLAEALDGEIFGYGILCSFDSWSHSLYFWRLFESFGTYCFSDYHFHSRIIFANKKIDSL